MKLQEVKRVIHSSSDEHLVLCYMNCRLERNLNSSPHLHTICAAWPISEARRGGMRTLYVLSATPELFYLESMKESVHEHNVARGCKQTLYIFDTHILWTLPFSLIFSSFTVPRTLALLSIPLSSATCPYLATKLAHCKHTGLIPASSSYIQTPYQALAQVPC